MVVKEIIAAWLKAHRRDGLFNADGECACILGSHFMPCNENCSNCQPGYLESCNSDTCPLYGDHPFHISTEKPKKVIFTNVGAIEVPDEDGK